MLLAWGAGVIQEGFPDEEELREWRVAGDNWAKKGRGSVFVKRINASSTYSRSGLLSLGSQGEEGSWCWGQACRELIRTHCGACRRSGAVSALHFVCWST